MKYLVDVLCNLFTVMRIPYIPSYNFKVRTFDIFKPTLIVERIILRKSADLVSTFQKHFCEMRADKTVGTGY